MRFRGMVRVCSGALKRARSMCVRTANGRWKSPITAGNSCAAAADGSKVLLSDGHLYGHLEGEPPVQEADLRAVRVVFWVSSGRAKTSRGSTSWTPRCSMKPRTRRASKRRRGRTTSMPGMKAERLHRHAARNGRRRRAEADWAGLAPVQRTAQASPDGRWVAFRSKRTLTGMTTSVRCKHQLNAKREHECVIGPCSEVFVYDSVTGKLTCASCNPSGALPLGSSYLPTHPIRGRTRMLSAALFERQWAPVVRFAGFAVPDGHESWCGRRL